MPLFIFLVLLFCTLTAPAAELSMKGILGTQPGQQNATSTSGFKRVLELETFHFPRDHLSHQDYQTEWWYFSGNLTAENQDDDIEHLFAYQFTLFRFAMAPGPREREGSAWRTNNVYMAHLALTDISGEKAYRQERFSRDGPGLAGADQEADGTIRLWLNNWRAESLVPDQLLPLQLHLQGKDFALNLQLQTSKPMVLQGDRGFSQKSAQAGNASYYYSYTRLRTKGTISIGQTRYPVTGNSWLDREWSTSSLGDEQQGWDWFALHLDDGSELMLYQMRNKDGGKDPYSSGTLIAADGDSQTLHAGDFAIKALDFWDSPVSGIRYPIKWQLLLPEQQLELIISTQVKQQEWAKQAGFSFDYWEGAVRVSGGKNHQPISGAGYLEMTGYESR